MMHGLANRKFTNTKQAGDSFNFITILMHLFN